MNKERRLEKIIEGQVPAILSGQETLPSVLDKYPKEAAELKPRLEAALWIANAKKILEPRPGFIHSSRAYLEEQLVSMHPRTYWRRLMSRYTPQRWVFNLAAPILIFLVLALVINNLILTARLSIPGDPLYTTKLAIEDAQLAFTFDPVDKTNMYIKYSRERTTEFVELVLEGEYDQLPNAADRLETETIAALYSIKNISRLNPSIETSLSTNFRVMLSNETTLLKVLRQTSPTSAYPGIDLAIQVTQEGEMALR